LSGSVASGQPASLTIYRNTGGNFNAPPVTDGVAVGTATLSFDSCTSGQLTYSFTDGSGRSGNIPLTRLTRNETCSTTSARSTNADFALSGNWYVSTLSGQGFSVEVNPSSGLLFFAWYTYAPSGVSAGAAGQRWYTGSSTAAFTPGSRSIPVTIYETTGGTFDTPTAPHIAAVGTGTFAFLSCASATLNFTFSGGSSAGASGTIALSRIGPVPLGCAPLSVGGSYPTTASLVPGANTCGSVTVMNAVTTVAMCRDSTFYRTHAGNTYTGPSRTTGGSRQPKVVTGGGSQFTITIDGTFYAGRLHRYRSHRPDRPDGASICRLGRGQALIGTRRPRRIVRDRLLRAVENIESLLGPGPATPPVTPTQ
jgi:hypothetical protein